MKQVLLMVVFILLIIASCEESPPQKATIKFESGECFKLLKANYDWRGRTDIEKQIQEFKNMHEIIEIQIIFDGSGTARAAEIKYKCP